MLERWVIDDRKGMRNCFKVSLNNSIYPGGNGMFFVLCLCLILITNVYKMSMSLEMRRRTTSGARIFVNLVKHREPEQVRF